MTGKVRNVKVNVGNAMLCTLVTAGHLNASLEMSLMLNILMRRGNVHSAAAVMVKICTMTMTMMMMGAVSSGLFLPSFFFHALSCLRFL